MKRRRHEMIDARRFIAPSETLLQGLAMYAVVAAVLAVLVPICATIFIIFRYMCCCCRADKCSCVRCGLPWPTRRTCCCGFKELANGSIGYTTCDKYGSALLLSVFVLFIRYEITSDGTNAPHSVTNWAKLSTQFATAGAVPSSSSRC